uniref:Putative ovule protein n=1 Tax=Solanum chacoense TaxID=4108 RepID=A0A0V0GLF4_SOLCH
MYPLWLMLRINLIKILMMMRKTITVRIINILMMRKKVAVIIFKILLMIKTVTVIIMKILMIWRRIILMKILMIWRKTSSDYHQGFIRSRLPSKADS